MDGNPRCLLFQEIYFRRFPKLIGIGDNLLKNNFSTHLVLFLELIPGTVFSEKNMIDILDKMLKYLYGNYIYRN